MKVRGPWLRSVVVLGMMLVSAMGVGCDSGGGEDKDNKPGAPVTISGESTLRVIVSDDITNVYFDGDYLGTVAPGETRDYDVPTGTHKVKFTNAEKDNQKPGSLTIDFMKDTIHPVTVRWKKEDNSIF